MMGVRVIAMLSLLAACRGGEPVTGSGPIDQVRQAPTGSPVPAEIQVAPDDPFLIVAQEAKAASSDYLGETPPPDDPSSELGQFRDAVAGIAATSVPELALAMASPQMRDVERETIQQAVSRAQSTGAPLPEKGKGWSNAQQGTALVVLGAAIAAVGVGSFVSTLACFNPSPTAKGLRRTLGTLGVVVGIAIIGFGIVKAFSLTESPERRLLDRFAKIQRARELLQAKMERGDIAPPWGGGLGLTCGGQRGSAEYPEWLARIESQTGYREGPYLGDAQPRTQTHANGNISTDALVMDFKKGADSVAIKHGWQPNPGRGLGGFAYRVTGVNRQVRVTPQGRPHHFRAGESVDVVVDSRFFHYRVAGRDLPNGVTSDNLIVVGLWRDELIVAYRTNGGVGFLAVEPVAPRARHGGLSRRSSRVSDLGNGANSQKAKAQELYENIRMNDFDDVEVAYTGRHELHTDDVAVTLAEWRKVNAAKSETRLEIIKKARAKSVGPYERTAQEMATYTKSRKGVKPPSRKKASKRPPPINVMKSTDVPPVASSPLKQRGTPKSPGFEFDTTDLSPLKSPSTPGTSRSLSSLSDELPSSLPSSPRTGFQPETPLTSSLPPSPKTPPPPRNPTMAAMQSLSAPSTPRNLTVGNSDVVVSPSSSPLPKQKAPPPPSNNPVQTGVVIKPAIAAQPKPKTVVIVEANKQVAPNDLWALRQAEEGKVKLVHHESDGMMYIFPPKSKVAAGDYYYYTVPAGKGAEYNWNYDIGGYQLTITHRDGRVTSSTFPSF